MWTEAGEKLVANCMKDDIVTLRLSLYAIEQLGQVLDEVGLDNWRDAITNCILSSAPLAIKEFPSDGAD